MQIEKTKIVTVLICCFLVTGVIAFIIGSEINIFLDDSSKDQESRQELTGILKQNQQKQQETETIPIKDLEILLGDIGDALDMIWSNREITCDFSNKNKIKEIVRNFPIVGNVKLTQDQLDQLYNWSTEMIFNHGNNNFSDYIDFLRMSGESIGPSYYEGMRKMEMNRGIPEKEIPNDHWELLSKRIEFIAKEHGRRTYWKGLVSEGSRITIFEATKSDLPIGSQLKQLRGSITIYKNAFFHPISVEQAIGDQGNVIMVDVRFFIAHDDSIGGVIWPYIARFWFDTVNNSWRAQKVALLSNRHTAYPIYILP